MTNDSVNRRVLLGWVLALVLPVAVWFAPLPLDPLDLLGRFLQHILPRGFARVRTFGWLHPAAKVRANRVRALLRQPPLLTSAEQQAWDPPTTPDVESPGEKTRGAGSPPPCPRCQKVMVLVGSWRAGQVGLHPKRPP